MRGYNVLRQREVGTVSSCKIHLQFCYKEVTEAAYLARRG